jgi:membrane protein YdbS with pleckstrin-like domain
VCPVATNTDNPGTAGEKGRCVEAVATIADRELRRTRPHDGALVTAIAVTVGILGAVTTATRSLPAPELVRGEVALFRGHPRRAVRRYVMTFGLWGLTRKTTCYTVTKQRVIVERGLIRRHARSIPLASVASVDLVAGPWEGAVRLSALGSGAIVETIGPLRVETARRLAATIAHAIATDR